MKSLSSCHECETLPQTDSRGQKQRAPEWHQNINPWILWIDKCSFRWKSNLIRSLNPKHQWECVCVYVFVCVTSLRWLQPPCRGLPVHESSTAQQWCRWLRAEEEDSVALVGGPLVMELDQKQQQQQQQQQPEAWASGQLVVKHI